MRSLTENKSAVSTYTCRLTPQGQKRSVSGHNGHQWIDLLIDWLSDLSLYLLIYCSEQQPTQPTQESSTAHPDLVYAHIVPSQEPDLHGNNQMNANASANNSRQANDAVLYSDLQSMNNQWYFGDLYTHKRRSVKPTKDLFRYVIREA